MKMDFKLTQFSHGAGCGCKIAPKVLDSILQNGAEKSPFANLLVGNEQHDDAAVLDLGDGSAVISTTDFFMPIVDDPFDFGRIASVNAISDVYAMGGSPLLAIAILGWPIDKLPPEVANQVVEGARRVCEEAGIPLAGGHSIDSPEPIFGLAVTGRVDKKHLKTNGAAKEGDLLFLTKAIGVGILSTAQKKGVLQSDHALLARDSMVALNKIGEVFARLPEVHAMTDVTGFGLMGHLTELCEASDLNAVIEEKKVPLLDESALDFYLSKKCVPGGTHRNWDSYGHKIDNLTDRQRMLFCDPQTSGGLLVAVDPKRVNNFLETAKKNGFQLEPIGHLKAARSEKLVRVI